MLFRKQLKYTIILLNLILVTTTFASRCPPISYIRDLQIIKASKDVYWLIMSQDFEYHKRAWNSYFAIKLSEANTTEQAIEQTQTFLKNINLHEPILKEVPGGGAICIYAEGNEDHSMITADNPPLHFPSNGEKNKVY